MSEDKKTINIADPARHERDLREHHFVAAIEQAVDNIVRQTLPPGSSALADAQHRSRATTQIVARTLVEFEERIAALERAVLSGKR